MPIAVTCPKCGEGYELDDDLAGKKGRCKWCAAVFPIPLGRPKSARRPPAPDLFDGLDQGPAVPRVSRPAPEVEPGLPNPPRGPVPRADRPRRSRPSGDHDDPAFRNSLGLISFGILAFVLPMVGLQWKGMHLMGEHTQAIIGGAAIVLGGLVMAFASPEAPGSRMIKYGVLTIVPALTLTVGVGFFAFNWGAMWDQAPAPPMPAPVVLPAPAPPPAAPRTMPMPIPMPTMPAPPPDAPRTMPMPTRPMPTIPTPPRFGGPGFGGLGGNVPNAAGPDAAGEQLFTLTEGKAAGEAGAAATGRRVSLRVDYQGRRVGGFGRLVMVIESPGVHRALPVIGLRPGGGRFSGTISGTGVDAGPYRCYLATEAIGGASRTRVSNVADLAWMGDQGLGPETPLPASAPAQDQPPTAMPRRGPMMPRFGPPIPGRPRFGRP